MPKKRHSDTTRSPAPLTVDEALAAMLRTPVMTASAREGLKRLRKRKPTKKRAKKRKS